MAMRKRLNGSKVEAERHSKAQAATQKNRQNKQAKK